ncbi:carbohydrate ABC transporter permease [Egicoccus halophilus]|uniref:sn-glycerol-3-phosphate transport system permease protein UgpE n=1 Tax=Egicoccus halophilus TaxID=1670830 RepID=A0A8J3ESQ5_9ACTN|nr:carbohydrate ABC transporter permease [Egicoccus halophilus]GGI03532.1 sn-glycerol-3-phosphate transport system permease protein UgpE [Egicoccus halophilus]
MSAAPQTPLPATDTPTGPPPASRRQRRLAGRIGLHVLVLIGAIVSIVPFLWIVIASTHPTSGIFSRPPNFLPGDNLLTNLSNLQAATSFARVTLNSLIIAVAFTAIGVVVCSMCGYGLAKHRFKGRGIVLALVLMTVMIPYHVTLVPLFRLMANLGWLNTYQAAILPFVANAFGIFLMRQAFLSFPDELIEAARVDGAGELRTFYRIVLPAVRPSLAALVIYLFMFQWNNFLWPLVVLTSGDMYTIPVALSSLIGLSRIDYGQVMVGTAISVLPVVVVFLFFQKHFIAGLLGGSVRG